MIAAMHDGMTAKIFFSVWRLRYFLAVMHAKIFFYFYIILIY